MQFLPLAEQVRGPQGWLRGWRLRCAAPPARGTVLYLHGNASNIAYAPRVSLYGRLVTLRIQSQHVSNALI